jgi:uncharacterized protein YyaL (SSP411 family)
MILSKLPIFGFGRMVWSALGFFWFALQLFPNPLLAHENTSVSDVTPSDLTIQWVSWAPQAFDRAKNEDKLILLDLTAVWCHACHVMDETTYVNPKVVELLNSTFISVRVETDQRPDIEARYKHGGWPTTSILLPSGEILFQANSLTPEELLSALQEAHSLYRENKSDLIERAAEVWGKVEAARKSQVRAEGPIHQEQADHMLLVMKQSFDQVYGGFRDAPKFFEPEAITFAFEANFWRQDSEAKQMALLTLDQQIKLIDPVWGGFYRYAENADWTSPHFEKMLPVQAQNVLNYLEAYQLTKAPRYRDAAHGTIQYVSRFLADRQRGGFFASQDADVRGEGSHNVVPGKTYFGLGEAQRISIGLPYLDRSIYTGWNGLMAKSFLKAYQVFGDPQLREFALKTLTRLCDERYRPGKGLAHMMGNGRLQEFALLEDQVWFADAMVEAYVTTGQSVYRDRAEQIIHDLVSQLEDKKGGGFFDRPPSSTSRCLLKFPYKDVKANASLALLLSDVFYVTQKIEYRDLAKQVLQYVVGRSGSLPVGIVGLAINRHLKYPVHIVVVGEKADQNSRNLLSRALELYAPGKLVRYLDPQVDQLSVGEVTFPRTKISQAYVCTDKLCSSPISNADTLRDHLDEVMAGLLEASEPLPTRLDKSS